MRNKATYIAIMTEFFKGNMRQFKSIASMTSTPSNKIMFDYFKRILPIDMKYKMLYRDPDLIKMLELFSELNQNEIIDLAVHNNAFSININSFLIKTEMLFFRLIPFNQELPIQIFYDRYIPNLNFKRRIAIEWNDSISLAFHIYDDIIERLDNKILRIRKKLMKMSDDELLRVYGRLRLRFRIKEDLLNNINEERFEKNIKKAEEKYVFLKKYSSL